MNTIANPGLYAVLPAVFALVSSATDVLDEVKGEELGKIITGSETVQDYARDLERVNDKSGREELLPAWTVICSVSKTSLSVV